MKKRIFASLLAMVMAFSLLPASALAAASNLDASVPDRAQIGNSSDGSLTYIQKRTPQQNEQGGVKNSTVNVREQQFSLTVNEQGTYKRLPASIESAGSYYVIWTPSNFAVPATGNVTVSEEGIIGDCSFSLGWGTLNGYSGTYPCLQFNYTALKAGTVTVTLHYYYNYARTGAVNGTVWWKEDATFTVTVGEQVKPTGKPNISNFSNKISFVCDTDSQHDATADFSDSAVTNGYSFGDIVANDGQNSLFSITEYPWMCVLTFNTQAYLDGYNSVLSGENVTHYLAANQSATETFTFYSKGNGKWSYDSYELPVVINITHTKPATVPEKPDVDNLYRDKYKNLVGDGGSTEFAVVLECNAVTGHMYGFKKLSLVEGGYTLGEVEANTGANKEAYPYICKMTVDYTKYVARANVDYSAEDGVHTLVDHTKTSREICWYYDGTNWTVLDSDKAPIVIPITCEPEPDPTQPDEDKLYNAIENSQVLVKCETMANHPVAEMKISAVDSARSGIQVTHSENGTVATVEITNPEAYAAAYKPGDVTHTYKAEGSRLTFTLTWDKDDTTGEWDYHLTGESPLINTVCEITPEKYTVHYDLNGGKGASGVNYDDVTVSAGDKITVLAAPTRSGYTFKGWKAGETTYQPGDKLTVNGAITFTAQWSKKSSSNDDDDDYTLRYVTNGGKAISSESRSRSWVKDYEDLPVPTRVGYRFNGWYYDTKLTKAVTGDVQVSSRTVTLYAGWTENSVPAILNGDDHFAYIQGYNDGTVRPNTPVTRAQVATILFRLLDEDVRDKYLTETNTFTDVAADYWANTAISTMANLGVFKGRTADRFDPNAPITRGEFAAVCARFDDSSVQSSNAFSDIDGYWAKQEILRAAALGWVQGYQDGTFRPTASITRAQVVTMINRVLCRQPETASDLLRGMTTFTDCAEGDWCYLAIQEAANSHDYVGKSGSIYESWTDLNKSADWSKYEH